MAADVSLAAIERAAVRGWPALETAVIDGWLARASSGGSVRANTVSALDYCGGDLDRSIAAVRAFYRQRGLPARFTITEVDNPGGLDAALADRNFVRSDDHLTFAKDIAVRTSLAAAATARQDLRVDHHDAPTAEWFDVYLQGLSGDRRAVAPRLVQGVPGPRAFFSCFRDGQVIASGLSVADGSLASVQCMATLAAARRSGAASLVLAALETWAGQQGARRLYLQTDLANVAATSLYARQGFQIIGRYHTRELAG